jgi:hypothetical protein
VKTLKKLHLKKSSNFLSEWEMKSVVGSDEYDNASSGTYEDPYQLPGVVIYGNDCYCGGWD